MEPRRPDRRRNLHRLAHGLHHPDGAGATTTLAIRRGNDRPELVAQPGDWIAGKRRTWAGIAFAAVTDEVFTASFTADKAVYR